MELVSLQLEDSFNILYLRPLLPFNLASADLYQELYLLSRVAFSMCGLF